MANITLKMKDGRVLKFMHEGRAGGSYTKTVRYEGEFAIVQDEYGVRRAFLAADIAEVVEEPHRGGW